MAEVRLETTGEDRGAGKLLDQLKQRVADLESLVAALSGKPLRIPTDPAEAALKELRAELTRLERAFDRAEQSVNFARARNEIERTETSARRLANAESALAARGRELIDFSNRLPPSLRRASGEMDRLERETEQAAAAFRRFQAAQSSTGRGISGLISSINSLRAGLAAFIAALGIQQILRFARALIDMGSAAVETKLQFDRLIPGLRAFTGSTELANEVAARLAATADRLKTPLAGLVNPFLAIEAGGREAGLSISEINDLFEASLLSARAFGKGADEVQRLLTGISQVAGKGVASMEEFRQQIGEAIPNAIPALAKGLSLAEGRIITTAEAIARISSGSLPAAEALRALTAGFEALNAAAAEEQLKTLAGDLGALERASEEARRAIGDGLEPGLRLLLQAVTDLIRENPALIRQLGEFGSSGLAGLAELVQTLERAAQGYRVVGQESLDAAARIERLPAPVRLIFGLDQAAEGMRNLGNVLAGVEAKAKVTFDAVEDGVRTAALGSRQSAEDILEAFRKSFEESAKAAGAGALEIEQNSKDLADAVGDIAERSAKERTELERQFVEDAKRFGEVREETLERAGKRIFELEKEAAAARAELLKELVESTKRATEERIRLEAEAAAKARAEAAKIVEGAREIAQERIAEDEKLHTRRQELEAEALEKILAAQEDFVEKLKKPKADREKLAEELRDKVIEIERNLAESIRDEQEKVAKASEEAAERRIKAEQAVQAEYDGSIEKLRELVDTLNEAAEGPDQEGGGLSKVADDAERARDAIDEADQSLGGLLVTLEELNAGNLGNPLEKVAGSGLDLLGSGAGDFFDDFNTGADTATGHAKDFGASLDAALDAAEGLQGGARDAVLDLVDRYSDLAEAGAATLDDQRSFAADLVSIFDGFGVALDDPVAAIQERLEELKASQSDATVALQEAQTKQEEAYQAVADAAGSSADAAEDAGERADVAWDPLTNTLSSVEEAADAAGEAAEEAGIRIEKSADGITITNEALGETKDAGEAAAEGLAAAGEAANEAAGGLKAASEAAEGLKGEIVAEGTPDLLRDLGAAAGEATPLIQPLAEPVQTIAEASAALALALPVISEALPAIAEQAGLILTALEESEVDFDAIAASIEALAPPLTEISTALPLIQTAVAALPEPITALQAAAAPLFEVVLAAAEDDRFGRIGQGLASIAAALPPIPEPMERLQAVLEKIVAQREDISGALQTTAEGLAAVGAEEILAGLGELVDSLDEALGLIGQLDEKTKSWQTTLSQIVDDMPELIFALGELAAKAREDVAPGLDRAAEAARLFKEDLESLKATAENVFPVIIEQVDATTEKVVTLRTQVQGLAADFRDAAAAAQELATAAAAVSVGTG